MFVQDSRPVMSHLLVAEDNLVNQRVVRDVLEQAGYTVDVVENGAQVLEAVARARYDLVLLDCQMPVMDGFAAVRLLRANPATADLKVVAMTANAMRGDREDCLAAGMDDHMAKPFSPPELVARVSSWLSSSRARFVNDSAERGAYEAPLDESALDTLAALDDDGTLLADLVALFRQSIEDATGAVQSAIATMDFDTLARTAHTLKSSSTTLGLLQFAQANVQLEQAARACRERELVEAVDRWQQLAPLAVSALDVAVGTRIGR